jgi:hypothetical protein
MHVADSASPTIATSPADFSVLKGIGDVLSLLTWLYKFQKEHM